MFKGFQNTGKTRITYATSQMFQGFPSNNFAQSPNPWIVTDSIIAWWDSQNGITLNSGTTVSAWADKISGVTLTQATAVNQPIYTSANSSYRNYPSVNITVAAQNMSAGNVLNIGTDAGRTIFMVSHSTASSGGYTMGKNIPFGLANGDYAFINNSGGDNMGFQYHDGVSAKACYPNTVTDSALVSSLVIDRTNGLLTGYANYYNTASIAISTSLSSLTSTNNFAINNRSGFGAPTYYFEIIIYNRTLTPAEISQNTSSLRAKYGF